MKKKIMSLLLSCLMAALLCVPVLGESQLDYVTDAAGILTQEESLTLNQTAEQIAEQYACGMYVIVLNDFTEYVDTDSVEAAAQAVYEEYELGTGEERSGILLLLSLAERDYALCAYGYGNTAFTDYGKDYLSEAFLDNLGGDDWYGGFSDYLSRGGEMLESAANGTPVDVDTAPQSENARAFGILACILLGFLIAFIVRMVLKGQLKSVAVGHEAEAFIAGEGLKLEEHYDQYTHSTQSRVYSPQNDDKSSGGTTVNSADYSGKSGKF